MKIYKIYNKKQIKTKAHVISKHPAPLDFPTISHTSHEYFLSNLWQE